MTVSLSLIGEGRETRFKHRAREHGLTDDEVRFHGYLPHRDALARMMEADIGLIPHYATEHCQTTIPNKVFDYMGAGLPVVAADIRPLARILRETGAGTTFRERDPDDLASVLGEISADGALRRMGEAGRRAVREKFNWREDETRLLGAVESFEAGADLGGGASRASPRGLHPAP